MDVVGDLIEFIEENNDSINFNNISYATEKDLSDLLKNIRVKDIEDNNKNVTHSFITGGSVNTGDWIPSSILKPTETEENFVSEVLHKWDNWTDFLRKDVN